MSSNATSPRVRSPATLWLAASGADGAPTGLMGHGGGQHKTAPAVPDVRPALTSRRFTVAAIDARGHGGPPRTAHDDQEIVATQQARAAGEPVGPIVCPVQRLPGKARRPGMAGEVSASGPPARRQGCSFHSTRADMEHVLIGPGRAREPEDHRGNSPDRCQKRLHSQPRFQLLRRVRHRRPHNGSISGPTRHRQIKPISCEEGNQRCRTFPPTQACCTRCPGSRG